MLRNIKTTEYSGILRFYYLISIILIKINISKQKTERWPIDDGPQLQALGGQSAVICRRIWGKKHFFMVRRGRQAIKKRLSLFMRQPLFII